MLAVSAGKTGTAPGTTTIRIGPGGRVELVGVSDLDLAWMLGRSGEASEQLDVETNKALTTHYEMRTARAIAIAAEESLKTNAASQQENLRTKRSTRVWSAVTALVGVGSLVVAVIALRRG